MDILENFKFLINYKLIRVIKKDPETYYFDQYSGTTVSHSYDSLPLGRELEIGRFYWLDSSGNMLPLHPLFIFWEEPVGINDVAVYDHIIVKRIRYLLTMIGKTILGSGSIQESVDLIFKTLEDARGAKRLKEKFSWETLRETSNDISKLKMATVQHKYRPHLYLQRLAVHEAF